VPLDATHRALVSGELRALRALGTPAGEAAARFAEKRIEGYDAPSPCTAQALRRSTTLGPCAP
jgi:hypothetical protein